MPPYRVVHLADGWPGTERTVEEIKRLVNSSLTDPVVVTTAQNLVRHLPERDKDAEIRAVSEFVRRNIRYTNEGIETLKAPRLLLDEIGRHGKAVGDCDDAVLLWSALHRALGTPVRLEVVSQRRDGKANHIYGAAYSRTSKRWIADDTIVKNRPLGWKVPKGEITESRTFQLGTTHDLGGLSMKTTFAPGGAARLTSDDWMPREQSMMTRDYAARSYRTKHGGNLTFDEDTGEVGFIPVVAAAVPMIAKAAPMLKKLTGMFGKKKKKKKRGPVPGSEAPPPTPPACPPGYIPVQVGDLYEAGLGQGPGWA